MTSASAPAKINLALVVGPRREDGKHEVATVLQRVDLADSLVLEPADNLRVTGFAEDTIVTAALLRLAHSAKVGARLARRDRQAHPGRSRARRRELRCRDGAQARERHAGRTAPAGPTGRACCRRRCRRALLPRARSTARHRRRRPASTASPSPTRTTSCSSCRTASGKESTAAVYEAFDRRRGEAGLRGTATHAVRRDRGRGRAARPREAPAQRPRLVSLTLRSSNGSAPFEPT